MGEIEPTSSNSDSNTNITTASNTGITANLSGEMNEERIVGGAFVGFCLVGSLFFGSVAQQVFDSLRVHDAMVLGVLPVSGIVGFVLALAITLVCFFNKAVHEEGLSIAKELKRVTWPSGAETKASTAVVIIVSVICALILFFYDFISSKIMSDWIPWVLRKIAGA